MLNCNSSHEPETHTLLHLYQLQKRNHITQREQGQILKARDTYLWLELESNWMLGLVVAGLYTAFPEAKYILTVRDPISWLESEINQEYEIGNTEPYVSAFKEMFGDAQYSPQEEKLMRHGLYSLDGYLTYWSAYHEQVVNLIPQDQLMIVPTAQISHRPKEICAFIQARGVFQSNAHSYARSDKKLVLTDLVDKQYLHRKVSEHTSSTQSLLEQCL